MQVLSPQQDNKAGHLGRFCVAESKQTALLASGLASRTPTWVGGGGVESSYEQSESETRDQVLSPQQVKQKHPKRVFVLLLKYIPPPKCKSARKRFYIIYTTSLFLRVKKVIHIKEKDTHLGYLCLFQIGSGVPYPPDLSTKSLDHTMGTPVKKIPRYGSHFGWTSLTRYALTFLYAFANRTSVYSQHKPKLLELRQKPYYTPIRKCQPIHSPAYL